MLAKSEIQKEALNLPAQERIELVVELNVDVVRPFRRRSKRETEAAVDRPALPVAMAARRSRRPGAASRTAAEAASQRQSRSHLRK